MADKRQQTIDAIKEAGEGLFRVSSHVPADKLEWKPLDAGRSVLELLQECSGSATVVSFAFGAPADEDDKPLTVEACKASWDKNVAEATEIVLNLSEESLEEKKTLPWGMSYTAQEMLDYLHWNTVYHTGQVNYIQTLYGDGEMY